jgi:hypothetical protein
LKILHSELIEQALEQLGPALTVEPLILQFKAYTQLIRGLSMHVSGDTEMALMTLSRFIDKGPPTDVHEELEEASTAHFYWRTAIIRMYVIANQVSPLSLQNFRWLQRIDPVLYTAMAVAMDNKPHISCFRLMHHYSLEVGQAKPIRFESLEDSLQRTPYERQIAQYYKNKAEEEKAKAPPPPIPTEIPSSGARQLFDKLIAVVRKRKD